LKKTFYSNGKLLLTAEYLVLDGAEALAVPSVYGQYLEVEEIPGNLLVWKSLDENGNIWFENSLKIREENLPVASEKDTISETLLAILRQAKISNPLFLSENKGFQVTTRLNFNRSWGLGTSSTLIANIAKWAEIDAYTLLHKSFGGSGYDIACALHNKPIIYSNKTFPPKVKEVSLDWNFKDELFFVYLNRKQDSKEAIANYRQYSNLDGRLAGKKEIAIQEINALTNAILKSSSLSEFENLLEDHEELLSDILGQSKIKELYFSDYSGKIKSLGGWGGDFILATRRDALDYFRLKGLEIIIPFSAMLK